MTVRLQRDLGESALCMQIVPIKDIAEMMSLNTEEVNHLTKGRIDLICWHVYPLRSTKSKAADGSYLVYRLDRKHFVDKRGLL